MRVPFLEELWDRFSEMRGPQAPEITPGAPQISATESRTQVELSMHSRQRSDRFGVCAKQVWWCRQALRELMSSAEAMIQLCASDESSVVGSFRGLAFEGKHGAGHSKRTPCRTTPVPDFLVIITGIIVLLRENFIPIIHLSSPVFDPVPYFRKPKTPYQILNRITLRKVDHSFSLFLSKLL